jgi:serine phosphatase RsbU (regulator of sigma subunit)
MTSMLVNDAAASAPSGKREAVWVVVTIVAVVFALSIGVPREAAGEDREEVVVLTPERLDHILGLSREWSYHPGDDPAWANPDFDDSSWALVTTGLRDLDEVPGGWPGIGWFRRRVMLDPAVKNTSIGVWAVQVGASELYVDGELAIRFGTPSADPEKERAVSPQTLGPVALKPGEVHLFAMRFSNARDNVFVGGFRGFEMWVGDVGRMVTWAMNTTRLYSGISAAAAGLFGAFALIHLLLFLSRPELRENLYFTIFNSALVAVLVSELWTNSQSDLSKLHLGFNLQMTCLFAMVVAALLLERRVFGRRLDIAFWVVFVTGVVTLAWIWTRPVISGIYPMVILIALGLADMLRLAIGALLRREPDAWVVAAGFAVLTLALIGSMLRNLGVLEVSPWPLFIGGTGTLVLAFSVYLTRRISRTDRALAQRLQEVQDLTVKNIEQEISRRVLEADNLRKTDELEEARRLQLAMLPNTLPDLPGFDLAVHMTTATEVGGDYYDFLRDDDGGWTVALGDATGHGLHAGMVVGVARSLLRAANGVGKLVAMLGRIHSGLANLPERRASMGLVLVRLNGSVLRLASAGMPPVLVRRRASSEVDEVLHPGVPLGTLQDAEWGEHEVAVSPGDSVLLMSDGLAEVVSPDGEPFGYDRVLAAFADAGALDPAAMVEHLVAAADTYRGEEAITDDVTLVVLRARR